MALASATLSTGLQAMAPTASAPSAAAELAGAYTGYMAAAVANGVTIAGAGLPAAQAAMEAAMSFAAGDSGAAGAAKFVAGVAAFWAVMVAAPATYWPGGTVIVPPTFAALASALASDFGTNTSGSQTLAQSAAALAASMHAATLVTPTLTIPPNVWAIT